MSFPYRENKLKTTLPRLAFLVNRQRRAGEALAISIPASEAAVIKHFQERMPHGHLSVMYITDSVLGETSFKRIFWEDEKRSASVATDNIHKTPSSGPAFEDCDLLPTALDQTPHVWTASAARPV